MKLKKTKIRIGIIVDQLLAGGVQLSAIEQVKTLNRMGHQAKLIILMRKRYTTDFSYLLHDVPHEYLSDKYPRIFRRTVKFPVFSFLSSLHLLSPVFAPVFINARKFDVLVSMGTTTSLTTQAIFRRHQIPYLAVIHDPIDYILETSYKGSPLQLFFPLLKPIATFFERSFIKDAKKTLIISKVHNEYLRKKYAIEPVVLPIGTAPVSEIPQKRGDRLLSFSRWQQKKNPQLLLELLKRIPRAKLLLAGSWTSADELESFRSEILRSGLASRIKLIPHYNPQMLSQLCAQARVFVHPHFEAFGLAALEAAAHGVPIIIPEKSGVTEGFIHGIHGYFPAKNDLSKYVKYANKLLTDPKLALQMGHAAWLKVKTTYAWDAIVKQLLEIIQRTCNLERKRTLKVIEIGHTLGTSLAGGDKLMEPMAGKLSEKYEISIIVPEIGMRHWRESPISKEIFTLKHNLFDNKGSPLPVFMTYCIRMWQTITYLSKVSHAADLLYSSTNILPDVLPAAVIKIFRPTFWVSRVHHLIPPPHRREGRFIVNAVSFMMQQLALFLIKHGADLIIVLNESLKQELKNRNFPENIMETVGAGINLKAISSGKFSKKNKPYTGIYLGRLHPAKGVLDIVPIWKNVTQEIPSATLAIIGSGERSIIRSLTQEISTAKLTHRMHVLGVLPDDEVYSLMNHAKIFLFTDHESGWGLAVAEAMASGLPIIGYDIGILESVYKDGFRTVPLGDTEQFAREVVELLRSEKKRLNLVKLAKQTAQKLDWNITTETFQKVLAKHFTPRLL